MIAVAFMCVLPWLLRSFHSNCNSNCKEKSYLLIAIMVFIPGFSYLMYNQLGHSSEIDAYYSEASLKVRARRLEIRPLLSELGKEEVRLRLRLEEFPNDIMVQCKLLDLLAIRALQAGDRDLADRYWQEALRQLPNSSDVEGLRNRMLDLRKHLKENKRNRR